MADFIKLTDEAIERKIQEAPRLASLRSINMALNDLVYAENSFTSQIAEIIRRDPSLTSRLLKLVNSVFFGLSQTVNNIEEAIFYLGLRQIRELALATPIIEDFEKMHSGLGKAEWHKLWGHSIGSGILTREIASATGLMIDDDTDYITGLVHNVGKIVIASIFPEQFAFIMEQELDTTADVSRLEEDIIGWDHAQIGAYYLEKHRLGTDVTTVIRNHNSPQNAGEYTKLAACVQLADHMLRSVGIDTVERTLPVKETTWESLEAWNILFSEMPEDKQKEAITTIQTSLERLPKVLTGLI